MWPPTDLRWSDLTREFRDRVNRTLICPNFDLGVLFSAGSDGLSQEQTDTIHDATYEAIMVNQLNMPFPITAWVMRAPDRGITSISFMEQTPVGICGHAFFRHGSAHKWNLMPVVQTNGTLAEAHLNSFTLSEDNLIFTDLPVHWGLYGATLVGSPTVAGVDSKSRDPDVSANNRKTEHRLSPLPHPRIIHVDIKNLQRMAIRKESIGGTHASPTPHSRRGHWRSKPGGNGKIWIRDTVVNEHLLQDTGALHPPPAYHVIPT